MTRRLVLSTGWGVGLMTLITPHDIRCRLLTTRGWLHQSYDADEVDDLLDDAADSLEQVSLWALITHSRMHALQAGHQRRRRSLKRRRKTIKTINRRGRK
ncbi:hypothetical protein GKC41_00730 [Bifidobacterium asteroides]|uniref:Uncharacterized protein n=2 Tax=Bifidobacterium asteroides TaxID=1684 RepID=A0A6N7TWG0_9BIFI|nr:hypothetical protein [Bifidobacterium asteroides]